MEKLLVGLICLFSLSAAAQDSLYVYKTKGIVLQGKLNDRTRVEKGALILPATRIEIQPQSSLEAINKKGDLFATADPGVYSQAMLLKRKSKTYPQNLTANYFKYIWSELIRAQKSPTQLGGVFRGNSLMLFPKDSTQITSSHIELRWQQEALTDNYFVFIREAGSENYLKMATNGDRLVLYENPFFEAGKYYEWAVTTEAFPNLKNLQFVSFSIITKEQYAELKEALVAQLQSTGLSQLSKKELQILLCENYNLCN